MNLVNNSPKRKAFKFNLSIENIKKIDRFGIGNNTNEKLRYILEKYSGKKINSKTRRSFYKVEYSNEVELLSDRFNSYLDNWKNLNKYSLIKSSCLINILKDRKNKKMEKFIKKNKNITSLRSFDWNISLISFDFTEESSIKILFEKEEELILIFISDSHEDIILNFNSLSEEESKLVSYLFDDLKEYFISEKKYLEPTICFQKTYSNSDYIKFLEFDDILLAELEYISEYNLAKLTMIK
jgi:hypothetical protein